MLNRKPRLYPIALAVGCLTLFGASVLTSGVSAAQNASTKLATFRLTDIRGKEYTFASDETRQPTVFFFLSTQCPISNGYTARINRLYSLYNRQGVRFVAVYPNKHEGLQEIAHHAKLRGYAFPVVRDADGSLTDRLGATMTPQVVLVNSASEIVYKGRIDDNENAVMVTKSDLKQAINAVLTKKSIAQAELAAFGCPIRRPVKPTTVALGTPTYSREVAPILRAKCEGCHRPGEVGPFPLQTYQQASAWAKDIKKYTQNGYMPPWKPTPGYGEFAEEHTINLNPSERTVLAQWVDAGAPQGNPIHTPPARKFTQGWQLGKPDMVLMPEKAYQLMAEGDDVYRNFVIDPGFKEDQWVRAVEVRAGNRAIVHHVINFIDAKGDSLALDGKDKDGQPGYTSFGGPGFNPYGMLGGWAPGNDPQFLPDGVAMRVPKGSRIVIQVHYHKNGKPETDQTRIGLHFARTTVEKQMRQPMVLNFAFQIPPGAARHEVKASTTINADSHVLGVTPHMHLLGREIKLWATLPNGTEKQLVWIKDWDFKWQATYRFKTPIAFPKGTRINMVAYYDNSPGNPRHPTPKNLRPVGWGEQTTDEMNIAFLSVTRDAEKLSITPPPVRTAQSR